MVCSSIQHHVLANFGYTKAVSQFDISTAVPWYDHSNSKVF